MMYPDLLWSYKRALQSSIQGSTTPISEDAEISSDGNYVGFIAFPVGGSAETYVQLFRVSDGALLGGGTDWIFLAGPGAQVVFSPDSQTMAWTSPSDGTIIALGVPHLARVTFSPLLVQGGDPTTGVVAFETSATVDRTVTLTTPSSDITIPSSVTVPAGHVSTTFPVTTSHVQDATEAPQ